MKLKKIFIKLFMYVLMLVGFTSCGAPKEMVGKYNLTHISGIPGATVSMYDYNYICLNRNYTYELENKAYGTITYQEGKWSYDEENSEIIFISKIDDSTIGKDVAKYNKEEKTIVFSYVMSGYNIKLTMTLEQ